jgi:restriction system protein
MPVPDFESLMLPILELCHDQGEHSVREAADLMARRFSLSEAEQRELLPSGRQAKLVNRTAWVVVYLCRAGLLERPGRGRFRITREGLKFLESRPRELNIKTLMQFPQFAAFRGSRTPDGVERPPHETLEDAYHLLRNNLADELLTRVRACSPGFFEKLVLDLLVAMGYGGSREDAARVGRSGDGGIDGIIKEDKLGLDAVYVQAKRWQGTVGSPVVQGFAGSLEGHKANKGVLITTSTFSKDAQEFVGRLGKRIVLIDGEKLAELMIDHGVGVTDVAAYTVKRVDSDYFEEE